MDHPVFFGPFQLCLLQHLSPTPPCNVLHGRWMFFAKAVQRLQPHENHHLIVRYVILEEVDEELHGSNRQQPQRAFADGSLPRPHVRHTACKHAQAPPAHLFSKLITSGLSHAQQSVAQGMRYLFMQFPFVQQGHGFFDDFLRLSWRRWRPVAWHGHDIRVAFLNAHAGTDPGDALTVSFVRGTHGFLLQCKGPLHRLQSVSASFNETQGACELVIEVTFVGLCPAHFLG
mmetsp:Transcript_13007/g.30969  ORF Transcript_13007/g.30969 Transcript_13007/m.30969 type:complete len:230 (-) Transcript_13007:467-1156(-)